jgi:hypothetical protein
MQLSESVYNKLAMQAAKALVEKDVPLNETLDKLAAEHDMNVEQLKRLCEATNNVTFNEAFAARGKQGSDDRLVEFKVASAAEILSQRVGAEKTASVRPRIAPDFDAAWESRPLARPEHVVEKVAHVGDPFLDVPTKPASPLALRAAYEHLRVEKVAEARRLADAANGVAACFRSMYDQDKFASFEKEAMTLHGALANEVLDHVRHTLNLPEVTRDFSKTAGRVVLDDKTQAHTLLKIAVQARGRLMVIHEALKQGGAL